jgi:23S rRNA U2552 (ribose-2'-O)-methylase RlmE/FtsJ
MVISVDRDYIQALDGAHVLSKSDITDKKTHEKIKTILNGCKADGVISDMVSQLISKF